MAEIHVIFPNTGDILMHNDCKPVLESELINWHIHCQNQKVSKVRIEFDKPTARYFPGGSGGKASNWCERAVTDRTTIWGRAPAYGKARRKDKYTIKGLDASGRSIAVLDPEIITNDPKHP